MVQRICSGLLLIACMGVTYTADAAKPPDCSYEANGCGVKGWLNEDGTANFVMYCDGEITAIYTSQEAGSCGS